MTATIRKVAWLHARARRLLCVRSRGRAAFYVPGGKPAPGEADEAALAREIGEELGLALDRATIALFDRFEAPADGHADTRLVIAAYRADAAGVPAASGEIDEIRWFTAGDAVPVSAATRQILQRLKADDVID